MILAGLNLTCFFLNFKLLLKIEFSTTTIQYNGSSISNLGGNSICSTLIASGGKYFSSDGWTGTGVGESDSTLRSEVSKPFRSPCYYHCFNHGL